MTIKIPQNDLPAGHHQSDAAPVWAQGFGRTAPPNIPASPDGAYRIIQALGTHNVQGRTFSVFVGTTAQIVLNGNPRRVRFSVQNVSGNTFYLGIGTPPILSGGVYLNAIEILNGGYFEMASDYVPINELFALGTVADQQLNFLECTKI